jgi:lipoprotein LprG
MRRTFSFLLTASVALALGGLSGCGDDADAGLPPAEAIAAATKALDETTGVQISLFTNRVPNGVNGIKSATGVGVHPAAFEGEFDLSVSGLPATAEVIAVGGVTYAKNSLLLPDWTEIDPADYNAPDPGTFMKPGEGLSLLISSIEDATAGESVRGGADNDEILTEYSGTVPASAVEGIIPGASGEFEVVMTITDTGELRTADVTGVFYEGADALTYTLTLEDYGTEQEITAPVAG